MQRAPQHQLSSATSAAAAAAAAQALSASVEAISRFQSAGKAWLRPPDYYAEMVKSDEQMAKIKDRLMYEQQLIDQAAER